MMQKPTSVDEYINSFPTDKQQLLKQMRSTLLETVPNATETIKYGMPTLVLHGNLVHYAAFANHIGYYPSPSGIRMFQKELTAYKTSKGAIQFPLDQPLPLELVIKIALFRVEENIQKILSKHIKGKKA